MKTPFDDITYNIKTWDHIDLEEYRSDIPHLGPGNFETLKSKLEKNGLVSLKFSDQSVGKSLESVEQIAQRLGTLSGKQSSGKIYHLIKSNPEANELSGNTLNELNVHTDGTHTDPPPAIILLQYRVTPQAGGNLCFVDMARVFESIFEQDQKYYHSMIESLSSADAITIEKPLDTKTIKFKGPMLQRSSVFKQRFSLGRFRFDDKVSPSLKAKPYFEELKSRIAMNEFRTVHTPEIGEIILIDNWRVLHGRYSVFSPTIQREHARVWVDVADKSKLSLGLRPVDADTKRSQIESMDEDFKKRISDYPAIERVRERSENPETSSSFRYLEKRSIDITNFPVYESAIQIRNFVTNQRIGGLSSMGKATNEIKMSILNNNFTVNSTFFDESIQVTGSNFPKFALAKIEPEDLSDAEEDWVDIHVQSLGYHDVKKSLPRITSDESSRHTFLDIQIKDHKIQHFFCLHYMVRFSDKSILCLKRAQNLDFESGKWSLSGEEQLRDTDLYADTSCEAWVNRAIFEEVFPLKNDDAKRKYENDVMSMIQSKRILSVIAEEYYGGFALVGLIQFNVGYKEYLKLRQKIKEDFSLDTHDKEGELHIMTHELLLDFLEKGNTKIRSLTNPNNLSEINENDLHSTSWYRIISYINAAKRSNG